MRKGIQAQAGAMLSPQWTPASSVDTVCFRLDSVVVWALQTRALSAFPALGQQHPSPEPNSSRTKWPRALCPVQVKSNPRHRLLCFLMGGLVWVWEEAHVYMQDG